MSTDPARAARQPAGCADDLKSNLLALVCRHSRAIIDTELHRLARRAPSLSPADLDVVNTMLKELAEAAILAPLRSAPRDASHVLVRIFGSGMNADQTRTETTGSRRLAPMTPAGRRRDGP
ncbi:hypothetical protein AB0H57_30330 [Micromonospora sp. NPDC050686]|uniref:hypothetical protein n=1 Tax=Micromonospora sp. NPDC050686 TaxID=3154631 RepID=UPI0034065EAC